MEQKQSIEDALQKLESIVEKLGEDTVSLEDSLALFSEGMKLSDACMKQLEAAELTIEEHLPRE